MLGNAAGWALKATKKHIAKTLHKAHDLITPSGPSTRSRKPVVFTVTSDQYSVPVERPFVNDGTENGNKKNDNDETNTLVHENDWEPVGDDIRKLYTSVKLIVRDVWDIPSPDRRRFPRYCPTNKKLFTHESDINHPLDYDADGELPSPEQDKHTFNRHFLARYPHLVITATPSSQTVLEYGRDPATVVKRYWKPEHLPLAQVGDAVFTGEHLAKWLVEWCVYVHGCDSVETELARDFGYEMMLLYETYMELDELVTSGDGTDPAPLRGSPRFKAIMGYLRPATEFCEEVGELFGEVARECQTAAFDGRIAAAAGGKAWCMAEGELGVIEVEAGCEVVKALFLPGKHLDTIKRLAAWAERFNAEYRNKPKKEDFIFLEPMRRRVSAKT
ncbi:hypothetical protein MN608_10219 [Microdochium nivale]|nr:hypothetical protein MN608_10219 [Microdochium nivale]